MDDQVGRSFGETRGAGLERGLSRPRRSRLRRVLRVLLIVLVLAALAAGGWFGWVAWRGQPSAGQGSGGQVAGTQSSGRPGAGRPGAAAPPQAVGAATVERRDIRVVLNALGTVTSLATISVKTQIAGKIVQIGFTEGQLVQKGDFLAQIDPRPYQVALDQAQGALARDQALLKNAQVDLGRYRTLLAQDSVSRQQVDTQASLVRQYDGTLKSDQAAIDSAQLNLTYCRIVAPLGGRVGLRQIDEGNYVQPGDATGLVVIAQLTPISVVFALPEDQIPHVTKAMHAGRTLPVDAWDRADQNKLAGGSLLTTDNQVDVTTGTVKLRAGFPNTDESLFPNQFVNAKLLVDTLSNVVAIPNAAVQRGEPGTFVYEIGDDGVVHVKPVKLGPVDGAFVAVTEGVSEGQRVVTDGADRLREGAKVTVPDKPAPGAAPGASPSGATPGPSRGGRTRAAP